MKDLVEFLRDRLGEDEQMALNAVGGPAAMSSWIYEPTTFSVRSGMQAIASHRDGSPLTDVDGSHIARHDPARVLREVEAKRRMLEAHAEHESEPHFCRTCGGTAGPCETKRLLALPYADHPDYKPDWAVTRGRA